MKIKLPELQKKERKEGRQEERMRVGDKRERVRESK